MTNRYKDRPDKSVNAPTYLRSKYAEQLEDGSLTLSDLYKLDNSLWCGLRNWANAGKHNLDLIIPRGKGQIGRPRTELGFDSNLLDKNDPRDVLALRYIKNRDDTRIRMAKLRQTRKLQP